MPSEHRDTTAESASLSSGKERGFIYGTNVEMEAFSLMFLAQAHEKRKGKIKRVNMPLSSPFLA